MTVHAISFMHRCSKRHTFYTELVKSSQFPRFDVELKEGTCMLWKPGSVQLKNVKPKNVGSYFTASQIFDSPAVKQAWCDS